MLSHLTHFTHINPSILITLTEIMVLFFAFLQNIGFCKKCKKEDSICGIYVLTEILWVRMSYDGLR